ncbi:TAXI family TRAP transporter solute-binding subunit [Brucella abortus]|nr:TAXI family TRAP transporter solute-binding subunit [Brucella abortus]
MPYWAYNGTGLYDGKGKVEDLRLLATLYPETIHIVARKDANIKSVADLKGKRVSLDEPGSAPSSMRVSFLKPTASRKTISRLNT